LVDERPLLVRAARPGLSAAPTGDKAGMGSEATERLAADLGVRHEMLDEGRRLVDAARAEGLALRLLGGLAVREHCRNFELCERDYSDLDMVAPAKQVRRLTALFQGFGYGENHEVSAATAGAQVQFVRPCGHAPEGGLPRAHSDDHIDVFLNTFRMDHDIPLLRRLEIEPYTVSLADLLLTKLQIFRLNEKDLRDIVTLLAEVEVAKVDGPDRADAAGADAARVAAAQVGAGQIDAGYIGGLCADDWGLFYDVTMNLQRVGEAVVEFGLDDVQAARVNRGVLRLIAAIDGAPKSLRWRLRARVGTHKTWHNQLDDQE
jgi:hypothetical protein